MRKHWPRWAFASFSKHFAAHFTAESLPLFVEGDDRATALEKKFCEFRMDGPRLRPVGRRRWEIFIPVNILVQTIMDDENAYLHKTNMGIAQSGFARTISIYKYGTGPDDDQSLLVCMSLMGDKNNPLKTNEFGQIDTTVRLLQATVEGHYLGHLTE